MAVAPSSGAAATVRLPDPRRSYAVLIGNRYGPAGLSDQPAVAGNLAGNSSLQNGIMGSDVHRGVVLALQIAVAILGILAFAAWVPVVRGLSQAQTDLAHMDTADIRRSVSD